MATPVVELRNVTKSFVEGDVQALRGVNLTIYKGELMSIMGPSGCGKSTLLNLIGALDRPTSGELLIDGVNLNEVENLDLFRSRKIGFIFQAFFLVPTLTALENVEIPMFDSGFVLPQEKTQKARQLLRDVGLEKKINQVPTRLSGGEKQRVAIARSLANDPAIILADEPTGNVDSKTSVMLIELLRRINQEKNATLIVVTHDPLIAASTNRVVQMLDGQIVGEKDPKSLGK